MDSTEISKIIFKGPIDAVKRYRWKAIGQLQILDNFMHFQGLKQHKRRIVFPNGVVINCLRSFNLRVAEIQVPSSVVKLKEEKIITTNEYLIIVYGDPEEYLSIDYGHESSLFLDTEAVSCTSGTGLLTHVSGNQLFGAFTMCFEGMVNGEDSGAFASIDSAIEEYYLRTYNKKEIFATTIEDAILPEDLNAIISPLDQYPISNVPANSDPPSRQEWSKTVGNLCVSAFIFYPLGRGSLGANRWAVSATMKDVILNWDTEEIKYYPPSGFFRSTCTQATCDTADAWINLHIGFDVWAEENEETGVLEYYIGIMADYEEEFTIWKYNPEAQSMEKQYLYYSRVRSTKFEITYNPDRHVRLIGYGGADLAHQKAYWCDLGRSGVYYEEDLVNEQIGQINKVDGYIVTTAWHPIERKLYFVTTDNISEPSQSGTPPWGTFSPRESPSPPNPYCYGYYTYSHHAHLIDPVDYEVIWNGNPYTVQGQRALCDEWPTSRDLWAGAWMTVHSESILTYQFGNFKIDSYSFAKGSRINTTETLADLKWQRYMPNFSFDDDVMNGFNLDPEYTHVFCEPSGRYDYELQKLGLDPEGGLSYEYTKRGYEEVFAEDGNSSSCVAQDWEDPSQGGAYTEYLCSGFPWDGAWRAVLLLGTGRNSVEAPTPKTEHDGLIIMKDPSTGELKLFGEGNTLSLGIYSRAFFKQVEIIQEIEV